ANCTSPAWTVPEFSSSLARAPALADRVGLTCAESGEELGHSREATGAGHDDAEGPPGQDGGDRWGEMPEGAGAFALPIVQGGAARHGVPPGMSAAQLQLTSEGLPVSPRPFLSTAYAPTCSETYP